ncbi:DUF3850 domain-containing protein [Enterococcus hirae]|uniref:DUF3850 domain-containing protein n=1 Tax=Enterococcus hirae TaxID=1354 RepID=UPI000BBC2E26|nr:DUF3850 domain-containing protein [Enterococcus hirae]PCE09873.1 hypothetical protein CKY13_00230 [Enterococcus hirae]
MTLTFKNVLSRNFDLEYEIPREVGDRDYKVGDRLYLREWNGENFTGDSYKAEITYITDYMQKNGYVVLGIE